MKQGQAEVKQTNFLIQILFVAFVFAALVVVITQREDNPLFSDLDQQLHEFVLSETFPAGVILHAVEGVKDELTQKRRP